MAILDEKTSSRKINKQIGAISRSAKKLNDAIHECALACLIHAKNYNDCTGFKRLLDALPGTHRTSLLIKWAGLYSPISVGKDNKGKLKAHLKGKAEERKWLVDEARANPFFDMPEAKKGDPEIPTYDGFRGNVIAFVKKAAKIATAIGNDDDREKALAEVSALSKATGVRVDLTPSDEPEAKAEGVRKTAKKAA